MCLLLSLGIEIVLPKLEWVGRAGVVGADDIEVTVGADVSSHQVVGSVVGEDVLPPSVSLAKVQLQRHLVGVLALVHFGHAEVHVTVEVEIAVAPLRVCAWLPMHSEQPGVSTRAPDVPSTL